jgi:hypothetical protein
MTRRSLSTRERLRLFMLHGGICHLCQGKIIVGDRWEISHDIPLELLGPDDDQNRKPAHYKCHRVHTAQVDIPNIAKAKRRYAANVGAIAKPSSLRSAGFPKAARQARATKPLTKTLPPRRNVT